MNPDLPHVHHLDAFHLLEQFERRSVDLFLFDPPYFRMTREKWDWQWKTLEEYVDWFTRFALFAAQKLAPNGSFIFFGGIGSQGRRPFWDVCRRLDVGILTYRNLITWKKRKAYGKSHDYLFCREEIAWYSNSRERTEVTFNIPHLSVERGYAGWNKKYPAKSKYKRVSNVWDDIGDLMRPSRATEKPVPLMERLVLTHSNPGDLVVDPFCGRCPTGVAALKHGRRFIGGDSDGSVIEGANRRCAEAGLAADNSK